MNGDQEKAEYEIEIRFDPRYEVLEELGIHEGEFTEALSRAIDDYWDFVDGLPEGADRPTIYEATIHLGGRAFVISDVATIEVSGDIDVLEHDSEE